MSVNYVSDVERGIKNITDPQTLRRLCNLLQIPFWKMGLSHYDPFHPSTSIHDELNIESINKISDSPNDRISDFKNCLLESEGDCFITGTSMIHLAEDSGYILQDKLCTGDIYLLILDADWVENHSTILTFIQDEDDRKEFHYEIRNSIRKLNQLRKSLPPEMISRFKIKTYRTFFPYIMTGFEKGENGKLVVEITDYIPDKNRPRFTLYKNRGKHTLYEQVKRKFYSLWNNELLTKGAMNEELYFTYQWRYQKEDLKFCPRCGRSFSLEDLHIPNHPQLLCHHCQFIFYIDPKLVVVAVVFNPNKEKVLLLQRDEEPGKGLWAFPGGHVERGSDLFETIQNEVKEETGLTVEVFDIIHTYSSAKDGLVQLTYEAIANREEVLVNIESRKGQFFSFHEIPWNQLAFPSTRQLLQLYTDKNGN